MDNFQEETTQQLHYHTSYRGIGEPRLHTRVYAIPLMGSIQKNAKNDVNVSLQIDRFSEPSECSLFNLVHHSPISHKKLHLKYNWKLIFPLFSRVEKFMQQG